MYKVSLVIALALVSSLAFAGEVKGPPGPDGALGGPTPNAGFFAGEAIAASICSSSGLNDVISPEENTQTQSYGTFIVFFSKIFGISIPEARELPFLPSPGQACNPSEG